MENFYANQCALTSHLNFVQCATCYHISRKKVKMGWDGKSECASVCMLKNTEKNAKKGELHICMHEKRKYI